MNDTTTHYGPAVTHDRKDLRRSLCGVVYKVGGPDAAEPDFGYGSSNLEHVTCRECLRYAGVKGH